MLEAFNKYKEDYYIMTQRKWKFLGGGGEDYKT